MGDVSKLQNGQTFQVVQKKTKTPVPGNMTIGETHAFTQRTQKEQAEISSISKTFSDRYSDNGKVELLVQDGEGVAVVSGRKISLAELSQKGNALATYALELKKFDENGDNHIEEHELVTSWGEHLKGSAVTIGGSTVAAAGTGATIGGLGGTAIVPGIGTVAGAGGIGLLGGAIGFVGSTLWEGVRTISYAANDSYNSAKWAR